jgi:diguanylate cyclase (GGDEF)-like protein
MKIINNRYEILSVYYHGEYGYIYKVRDLIDKSYPLKLLKLYDFDNLGTEKIDDFKNEYLMLKYSFFPWTAKVYEIGKINNIDNSELSSNYIFYTMDYIEGKTLKEILNEKSEEDNFKNKKSNNNTIISIKQRLFIKLASIIKNMHILGYAHGNLKSDNIIVSKEQLLFFIDMKGGSECDKDINFLENLMDKDIIENSSLKIAWERYLHNKIFNIFIEKSLYSKLLNEITNYKNLQKSSILNFFSLNYINFNLIADFISDLSLINGLIPITISLMQDPYYILQMLSLQLKLFNIEQNFCNKIDHIISSKQKLDISQLKVLLIDLFESINLSGNLVLIVSKYDLATSIHKNLIFSILSSLNNPVLTIINSHKLTLNKKDKLNYHIKNIAHPLITGDIVKRFNNILTLSFGINENLIKKKIKDYYHFIYLFAKSDLNLDDFFSSYRYTSEYIQDLTSKFEKGKDRSSILSSSLISFLNFFIPPYKKSFLIQWLNATLSGKIDKINRYAEKLLNTLLKKEYIYFIDNEHFIVSNTISYYYARRIKKPSLTKNINNLKLAEEIYLNNYSILKEAEKNMLFEILIELKEYEKIKVLLYRTFIESSYNNYNLADRQSRYQFLVKYIDMKKLEKSTLTGFHLDKAKLNILNLPEYLFDIMLITCAYYFEKENISLTINTLNLVSDRNRQNRFAKYYILSRIQMRKKDINGFNKSLQNLKNIGKKINTQEELFLIEIQILNFLHMQNKYQLLSKKSDQIIEKYLDLQELNYYEAIILTQSLIYKGEYMRWLKNYDEYKRYNEQAQFYAIKYGLWELAVLSTNHIFVYYYVKNDRKNQFIHIKKAIKIMEDNYIIEMMPTIYNNYAAIMPDVKSKIRYYLKSFQIATTLQDAKSIFILLHNLSFYLKPINMEKLLEKHNNFIFDYEIADIETNLNFLLSIEGVMLTYFYLDKLDKLNSYFALIDKLDDSFKKDDESYKFYKIIKSLILLFKYGFSDELFNNLTDGLSSIFSYKNYQIDIFVLNFIFSSLKDQKEQYFHLILKSISQNIHRINKVTSKSIDFLLEVLQKRDDKEFLKNIDLSQIEKIPLLDIPVLDGLYNLVKSIIYKEYNDKKAIHYLANFLFFINKNISYFKNKECLELTPYFYLLQFIPYDLYGYIEKINKGKNFSLEFEDEKRNTKYYEILKNLTKFVERTQIDKEQLKFEIFNSISVQESDTIDNLSIAIMSELYFDRVIFLKSYKNEQHEDAIEQIFSYISDNSLYFENEGIYLDNSFILNTDKPVIANFPLNLMDIKVKSALLMPVFELNKFVSIMTGPYDKRAKKFSFNSKPEYWLYLDKKNIIKENFNEDFLDFLELFLSYFFTTKNEQNEFLKDHLTGFYLKEIFYKKVSEIISLQKQREEENNSGIGFLFLDLDNFKTVNDSFGHQKGNEILNSFANIVKQNVRKHDLIGRYGGDEFIVALIDISRQNAILVAEKLKKKVGDARLISSPKALTVSIGISYYPDDGQWLEELIQIADKRMYAAKQKGKNQICSN